MTFHRMAKGLTRISVGIALLMVISCTALYNNHGYVPPDEALQKLTVGVDSRATVDDEIGAPTAQGLRGDSAYYYVRSRFREYGMFKPRIVSRQVVAISFDRNGVISNIERLDLADGKIVHLTRRTTDNSVVKNGFIQQLLRNFGKISPEQIVNPGGN